MALLLHQIPTGTKSAAYKKIASTPGRDEGLCSRAEFQLPDLQTKDFNLPKHKESNSNTSRHYNPSVSKDQDCSFESSPGVRLNCTGCSDSSFVEAAIMDKKPREYKATGKLLYQSYQDPDWNNSALDETCTTCGGGEQDIACCTSRSDEVSISGDFNTATTRGDIRDLPSSVKHLLFMKHMISCTSCTLGKSCDIAQELEADMSSFFEIDLTADSTSEKSAISESRRSDGLSSHRVVESDSMNYHTSDIECNTDDSDDQDEDDLDLGYIGLSDDDSSFRDVCDEDLDRLHCKDCLVDNISRAGCFCCVVDGSGSSSNRRTSILTTISDESEFVLRPLCKEPVTVQKSGKEKTTLLKKLKQFRRYFKKPQKNKTTHIKTLAVL